MSPLTCATQVDASLVGCVARRGAGVDSPGHACVVPSLQGNVRNVFDSEETEEAILAFPGNILLSSTAVRPCPRGNVCRPGLTCVAV